MVTAPDESPRRTPPDLPRYLTDLAPVVIVGTLAWVGVFAYLMVRRFVFDHEVGVWATTSLAGVALGLLGLSIVAWQRHASRRGSRGAQRGL